MHLDDKKAKFNYTETKDLKILELPYSGGDLSMLILLPKDSIEQLESELTIENLNNWTARLKEEEVSIYLPRFKFETKYFMAQDLAEMGMPTAFSGGADFSGMTGRRDLYISNVIHQAFVEVNEEGTEAAAATAVVMKEVAMMKKLFNADHPFIFIIREKETGNILFLGRVSDPTSV